MLLCLISRLSSSPPFLSSSPHVLSISFLTLFWVYLVAGATGTQWGVRRENPRGAQEGTL